MQQLKAGIRRYVWLVFVLWCVLALGIWQQSKQTMQTISTVNELGSKVAEVRDFFNFELPYRVQHVDQVSLKLQLVYAVRLQLERESSDRMITPNLTQLLYSTDRFLENAHAFIGSDSELVSLAEQLRNSRASDSNSNQVHSMYYRLGALVLESIFSNSATSADTYRELDSLFIESDSLVPVERTAFQRRLAQTSSVLAANAQGRYLAGQLLKPGLANQLATTNIALEQLLMKLMAMFGVVSGLCLVIITWANFNTNVDTIAGISDEQETDSEMLTSDEPNVNLEPDIKNTNEEQTTIPLPSLEKNSMEPEEAYIDIDKILDSLSGDEGAVRMLLEVFIQDHAEDGVKLRQLLKNDKEHALRIVHSLKGVSGSLGAMPLHHISSDIELMIKQQENVSEDKLAQLLDILEQTTLFADSVLKSGKIRETLRY